MNIRKFLRWVAAAAAIPGIGMATKVAMVRQFGQFGSTIEQARKTEFFSWFHLEETAREPRGGTQEVVRFQPSGPKFHDLAIVSFEMNGGSIDAVTMQLSRSFIAGSEEAFARDIAASFLRTALPAEDKFEADDLIRQISNDYRGSRTVILQKSADRTFPQTPTPLYEVFLGRGVEARQSLKHVDLRFTNTRSGGEHLLIRVDLARPDRIASPCGTLGRP